ncbi:unnamed protein product [Cylindrotheca closterium]|uniref:Uncharacterized protein n=1 Tax=Cylindrotheca closterium TaxID=2856 RepID=A0AAD2FQV8_9STRA|nr:unnamed protein product [Cylindrotheca closterium]
MSRQRQQQQGQQEQQEQQEEQDEQQEQMPARPEQRNQVHDQARQDVQQDGLQVQNFLEFTPRQQHAWLRARCDWCFAVADHFQPMTYTTVEIAINMLCDYMMHSGRLHELPMGHVLRCSTAASLRIAMLLNEGNYMTLQQLIQIGQHRFIEDEIFESVFHIYQCLGQDILSPETIESHAYNYLVFLESDGNGSIADLWQPLRRLVRLASRDLLFLQYPAQKVGLAAVVVALRINNANGWETRTMALLRALNIEEYSTEAAIVSEIGSRLLALHHRYTNADEM